MDFYFQAAKVLDRLDSKQGSIKSVLASLPESNRARTAALVIETLKYKATLTDVINASRILLEERKIKSLSLNLTLVLVHDLLLSRGIQAGDGPIKQAILRHKHGFEASCNLANNGDERAARIPRYVRVNTCLWTTEEAIRHYQAKGLQLADPFSSDKAFARDEHIPDLLIFHPQRQFHDDVSYTTGKVILQDKASCFPATVLAPPAEDDSVVIDATAAPGNKTSHLSALMANRGKLYAFERDQKRYRTLKTMLTKAGCKNVEAVNVDFLTVDPTDSKYGRATHILLDPSCSGSGIVNRLDHLLEAEDDDTEGLENRLNKLASFQLMMIKHAMKVAYSTCSIHAIENEQVVRQALNSEEAIQGGFKLAPRAETLPAWHRRGRDEDMDYHAESLIRCSPGEDATNGFFVACFIKTQIAHCTEEVKTIKRKSIDPTPLVNGTGPRRESCEE
ncbi:S-adenosyl-L-methionine-dependent methyltransferase [Pisolithus marmoratus]|nr:S-adenosyl-L-methionine-dependent methyltransferase [Pisolithus marmoratus]